MQDIRKNVAAGRENIRLRAHASAGAAFPYGLATPSPFASLVAPTPALGDRAHHTPATACVSAPAPVPPRLGIACATSPLDTSLPFVRLRTTQDAARACLHPSDGRFAYTRPCLRAPPTSIYLSQETRKNEERRPYDVIASR
jgi:hypothetical protein